MSFFRVGKSDFDKMARMIDAARSRGLEATHFKITPGLFQRGEGLLSNLVDYANQMHILAKENGTAKGVSPAAWAALAELGAQSLRDQVGSIMRERSE